MAKYNRSTYTRLPIFYDDDGRRIKTVYVSNIRERTTVESLEYRFTVYGPVQSCTLQFHPDSDERYGIVTMDYAYDASKILRDWPDQVKHLYSLLPKRMTKKLRDQTPKKLPKKEIIRKMNRIQVPLIKIHVRKCPQPSVAVISWNDEVVIKPVEELVAPVPRRRRVVKSTTSKLKERNTENKSKKTEKGGGVATVEPENVLKEELKDETLFIPTVVTTSEDISNPFTSLNDDCLISIFSSCDKLDLVSLSMVCERFRFIVYNYLKAKMSKIVDLSKIKSSHKITIFEATKFLRFIDAAQNTQELELTMSAFHETKDEIIVEKILKCCGRTLHSIKFTGFSIMESFANQWKHLLQGLKTIVFHQCIFSSNHFNELLKFCENLEVLNVTNSNSNDYGSDDDIKNDLSEFKCTKLKEFRLTSSRHCGSSSELIWLLENNPNLSVLQISDVGDSIKLSGETLQCIGQYKLLENLAFSFQNFVSNLVSNLHHLIGLKELKSLSLQCDWMNISTFVKQFSQATSKQVESLSFECIDIDTSFVKSIGRFRKLKYLKLDNTIVTEPSQEIFEQSLMDLTYRLNSLSRFHCQLHLFTEDTLVQFVERMKKLEHFRISGLVMNLLLFMRIVTACCRRINGLRLNIVIDNYQYLNEYLDLIRSEYGNVIGIQSLYD